MTDYRIVRPSVYVDTGRKQGQFIGSDVIYLRSDEVLDKETSRWDVHIAVSNGTIVLPAGTSLSSLNQAQVNRLFNAIVYRPFEQTSVDQLRISVTSDSRSLNCSMTILSSLAGSRSSRSPWELRIDGRVFDGSWKASIGIFLGQIFALVVTQECRSIERTAFFRFMSTHERTTENISKHVFIHDFPDDSGLFVCRTYMVNATSTPFFFLLITEIRRCFLFGQRTTAAHRPIHAGKWISCPMCFSHEPTSFDRSAGTINSKSVNTKSSSCASAKPIERCTRVDIFTFIIIRISGG